MTTDRGEIIAIGEWIYRGEPKNVWFTIVHQSFLEVVGRDEIDLCVNLAKARLKSYGKYEIRQPVVLIGRFFDIDEYFLGTCDISEGGKYVLSVFTEARIVE